MGQLISYMFTSLDGFIADTDGGLEWTPIDEELMRFANGHFGSVAGIVFGRNVYQGFVDFWDWLDLDDPAVSQADGEFAKIFREMPRIVVSRTFGPVEDPRVTVIDGDLTEGITAAKERAGGDLLLICGPELRASLAELGLIDRHQVLVAPVALGEGIPLFDPLEAPLRLHLDGDRTFGGGVVMLDYVPA